MQNTCLPKLLLIDKDMYPYFKDCIEAIDGTHIPAFVPEAKRAPFCNRKGEVSQNVLAACSFNFKFVYTVCYLAGKAVPQIVIYIKMPGPPISSFQKQSIILQMQVIQIYCRFPFGSLLRRALPLKGVEEQ